MFALAPRPSQFAFPLKFMDLFLRVMEHTRVRTRENGVPWSSICIIVLVQLQVEDIATPVRRVRIGYEVAAEKEDLITSRLSISNFIDFTFCNRRLRRCSYGWTHLYLASVATSARWSDSTGDTCMCCWSPDSPSIPYLRHPKTWRKASFYILAIRMAFLFNDNYTKECSMGKCRKNGVECSMCRCKQEKD